MRVREVRFDEIPQIMKNGKLFEKDSKEVTVDPDYATKTFQTMVSSGAVTMLALVDDTDRRVGGLAYIIAPDLYSGKMTAVELYWFVFAEERGCGKLLIDAFEESAKSKGCVRTAMIHMVDSYPETLKVFYEKRGYHLTEQHYVKEI